MKLGAACKQEDAAEEGTVYTDIPGCDGTINGEIGEVFGEGFF